MEDIEDIEKKENMEKRLENTKIEGRLNHVHEDIEEIKEFLRHIHNDVENMRRDIVMIMHKVDGVAFLHEVTRRDIEDMINVFDVNLDEIYSPIDAKDREEWKKHLTNEINERQKEEELEEL